MVKRAIMKLGENQKMNIRAISRKFKFRYSTWSWRSSKRENY